MELAVTFICFHTPSCGGWGWEGECSYLSVLILARKLQEGGLGEHWDVVLKIERFGA